MVDVRKLCLWQVQSEPAGRCWNLGFMVSKWFRLYIGLMGLDTCTSAVLFKFIYILTLTILCLPKVCGFVLGPLDGASPCHPTTAMVHPVTECHGGAKGGKVHSPLRLWCIWRHCWDPTILELKFYSGLLLADIFTKADLHRVLLVPQFHSDHQWCTNH